MLNFGEKCLKNENLKDYNENKKQKVEEIMATYKPLVCKIARQYFLYGGEMDDLVQEGMIGLYKAITSYDENKQVGFKNFAALCITRQIQSAVRNANSKKNVLFLQIIENSNNNFDVASNKENPEAKYIETQSYIKILQDIKNSLSEKEFLIFMEYLEGYTYDKIAQKLCISKKSVDNALVRIRQKLSNLLEKE